MFTKPPLSRLPSALASPSAAASAGATASDLPVWNLDDLYPAIDSPAVRADLDRAHAEAVAFEGEYKGKLADALAQPGGAAALAAVIRRYEALEELIGRLYSYAGLVYAGDSDTVAHGKF